MSKLICHRHDYAIKAINKIRNNISRTLRFSKDDTEELVNLLDDIDYELYTIIDEIEEAKTSGQKMEDRLQEYKSTIESLGFIRDK